MLVVPEVRLLAIIIATVIVWLLVVAIVGSYLVVVKGPPGSRDFLVGCFLRVGFLLSVLQLSWWVFNDLVRLVEIFYSLNVTAFMEMGVPWLLDFTVFQVAESLLTNAILSGVEVATKVVDL